MAVNKGQKRRRTQNAQNVQRPVQRSARSRAAKGPNATTGSASSDVGPSPQFGAAGIGLATRFQADNTKALRTGGYSRTVREGRLTAALSAKQLATEPMVNSILADLGGASEVGTIERTLVVRFAELEHVATWQMAMLIRLGIGTSKGRARALLASYLKTCDRQVTIAKAIGLRRRPRNLADMDLESYIESTTGETPADSPEGTADAPEPAPAGDLVRRPTTDVGSAPRPDGDRRVGETHEP